jgi:hypothetical protein
MAVYISRLECTYISRLLCISQDFNVQYIHDNSVPIWITVVIFGLQCVYIGDSGHISCIYLVWLSWSWACARGPTPAGRCPGSTCRYCPPNPRNQASTQRCINILPQWRTVSSVLYTWKLTVNSKFILMITNLMKIYLILYLNWMLSHKPSQPKL